MHKKNTNIPIRIIHQTNLPSTTFPIPYFPPTSINLFVMIITFTYPNWDMLALFKVNTLPRAYLTVDILETQWIKCSLGTFILGGDVGTVDTS